MKKWLKVLTALAVSFAIIGVLSATSTVSAAPKDSTKVYIDGKLQEKTLVINGRTMVQLTAFHDPDKLTYSFVQSTKTVVITYKAKNLVVKLKAGANTADVNGKSVKLDAPVTIKAGYTYLPLRFLSETLGGFLKLNGAEKQVIVRTPSGQERYESLMSGDLVKAREAALHIQPTYENKEIIFSGEGYSEEYTFPMGEALRYTREYRQLLTYIEINQDGLAIVKWQSDTRGQNGQAGKKPEPFGESVSFTTNIMAETLRYGTNDAAGTFTEIGLIYTYEKPEYKSVTIMPIPDEERTDMQSKETKEK